MPTRTTKKPTAKGDSSVAVAPPVKTSKRGAAGAARDALKSDKATPPETPRETVSLIDEDTAKPTAKVRRTDLFVPISKIRSESAAPPTPAKAEPPVVPAAPPAPAEAEPTTDDEEDPDKDRKKIHLKSPFTVADLAVALGLRPVKVIGDLMELQIFAGVKSTVEPDIAAKICEKHGAIFEREKRKKEQGVHKPPVVLPPPPPPPIEVDPNALETRSPVVTFMGHVDHGKTSLLDAIRKSRVAAGESGGITQHIGAYRVAHKGSHITFLDTPGHEAFTQMRARGTTVTDVVVIVIAADDGIMPTTLEAIAHAKAAKAANPHHFSIMVALNKIDLPGANPDRVKKQLQDRDLTPEDWGGETICCEVSATKGTGIDHLLDMIQLQSEMLELKCAPHAPARGIVIEAQIEAGRGPTATVIVQTGTIKVGQPFICGSFCGKVKSLFDDAGKPVKSAGPATPVKILGFTGLPNAGDEFVVTESDRQARQLCDERQLELRHSKLVRPERATLESLLQTGSEAKLLRIILKTDVQGSAEALTHSLGQIESKKVTLEVVHAAVGPVSESDVHLATASNAVIVGFNVKVDNAALKAAKAGHIQIKLYSIIYELLDQMKDAMAGLLDPETREQTIGHAEVKQIFQLTKGIVAGCIVTDGRISRTGRARVLRSRQAVYDGSVETLRRFQDDVKEVRSGLECGIRLGSYTEYEVGDVIECYLLEKVAQKL